MTKKQSRYNIFLDTTRIVKASELDILSETKLPNGDKKLVCKTCLQESMKKNKNKRIYKQNICESIVQQLAPAAKQRNLLMEIDHPLFAVSSGNPEQMKQRAGIVEQFVARFLVKEIKSLVKSRAFLLLKDQILLRQFLTMV